MDKSISSLNKITEKIIGCAIEVHRNLGPGLLESIYESALCYEFDDNMSRVTIFPSAGSDIFPTPEAWLIASCSLSLIGDAVKHVLHGQTTFLSI